MRMSLICFVGQFHERCNGTAIGVDDETLIREMPEAGEPCKCICHRYEEQTEMTWSRETK